MPTVDAGNEYLPTLHGFDEYAGVLYHLRQQDRERQDT
jgi:hypothetical protein